MNKKKPFLCLIFITSILFYFVSAKNTYAYLDPGTGSYLIQIIAAALLGALFSLRIFWSKIRRFLNNLFSNKEKKTKEKVNQNDEQQEKK